MFAGYSVGLRKRPPGPSLVFFSAMAPIAGLSSLFLLGAEMGTGNFMPPTLKGWLILGYVAIFPSLLAQIFFVRAVELIGPNRTSFYANLMPVFGAGLAVAILGESFHLYHAVAIALVFAGIALGEYRRSVKTVSRQAGDSQDPKS